MTIKLLTDWPYKRASGAGYVTMPAGAVVGVFSAATEAGMIAAKVAIASAAAVDWLPPSDEPVYTSLNPDEGPPVRALVSRGGNAAAARARDKVNLNTRPALIQAPVWVTATAYVVGDVRRLAAGQLVACTTAGTSGGAEPAFSATAAITDNTATWHSIGRNTRAPAGVAPIPTVTETAGLPVGALRYNLIEHANRFTETLIPASNVKTLFGTTPDVQTAGWLFKSSAAIDNGYGADGSQGFNRTIEFYSDSDVVEISNIATTTFANRPQVYVSDTGAIEDEFAINEAPVAPGATGAARHMRYVYTTTGGRKIRRWRIETQATFRSIGFVAGALVMPAEVTGASLIWYGDSYHNTVTPAAAVFNFEETLAVRVGRRLGFRQVRDAAVGGTGYAQNGGSGEYTVPQVLANNDLSFAGAHAVVCAAGYNDASGGKTPAQATAGALTAWQAMRQQQPNAVIVVVGPWSGNKAADPIWIAMDDAIKAQFLAWGDQRSGYISPMTGSVTVSAGGFVSELPASQPWVSGTGRVGATTANGNSDWLTGTDAVHPSPAGKVHLEMLLVSTIERVLSGMAPPL